MPGEKMVRMSVWVAESDRHAMALIREENGLASDSSALRYAVRRVAREIKADSRRKPAPPASGA